MALTLKEVVDMVLGGSHVHALASTSTGLTAVAHEQGVSLYNSHDDSWRDFTVLNGLPAGGVRAICFGSGDNPHCAMENGGYVRIDVRGTGRSAQRLSAPETWGKNRAVFYPLSTTGQGLCSNFCNGVSIGSLGQVYIASPNGISYSTTGGFRYLQGSDLKAKPKWEDMRKQPGFPKTDNCTAVCEDSQGRIWIGTSNMGVQVFHCSPCTRSKAHVA